MIILVARIEVDPAAMPRLRPLLDRTMQATWNETGCLSYSIAVESEAEGVISIVERWNDEKALLDYLATPAMVEFHDIITGFQVSLDARIYDVTGERVLREPVRAAVLKAVPNGISTA